MTPRRPRIAIAAIAAMVAALTACSSRVEQTTPPVGGPSDVASAPAAQATAAPPDDAKSGRATPRRGAAGKAKTPAPPTPLGLDPAAVEAARSATALAQVLTAAESAIRDPAVEGERLAAAAHTQQLVYRRMARSPDLRAHVIRNLPPGLRPIARANVGAGVSLTSLTDPQPKLPDWRIVRPAPADRLLRHYRIAAAKFGLEWEYLAAINLVETRMGRIRGRSTAGAQGPMQFMPATWDVYGRGDINSPADSIEAAARYLAASGAPQDMRDALWHYNHSDRYVDAVSAYAAVMRADPRAYRGYYHWQVYYRTPKGDVHLPEGYGS